MIKRPPSLSVVIPVWNQMAYLDRALSSVVWQLNPDDEVIVIDDASPEPDKESGNRWRDRVTWLENPTCLGECASRNRAILQAQGDWIKFLDADDVLAPFALDIFRNTIGEIPERVKVLTGGIHRIINGRYADYLPGRADTLKQLFLVNPMLPSATFTAREAMLEVELFDERIDFEGDWEMWLRLHERYGWGAFAVVNQPICYYWIDEQERREKCRHATVEGKPVRQYLRDRYGADPQEPVP